MVYVNCLNTRLSFSLLDDVLLANAAGRGEVAANALRNALVLELAPALEYLIQQSANPALPTISELSASAVTRAISKSVNVADGFVSLSPKQVEVRPLPCRAVDINKPEWISFQQRLKLAALEAGFVGRIAAGIVGAFVEMVENAVIYSDQASGMLAGYQWDDGIISYCIADNGIGVLESLRQCREFANLRDYATALSSAVQDGVSRFGRQSGHGFGFKQVLRSLAGLAGTVRLRSGDFSMELEGRDLTYIDATLAQRVYLQGFAASVICRSE